MIIGCFRGCFSFNAESTFEKARLQATYGGDYEPPSESDIQQVLKTLAGQDPETRPDVAFQLIQSKMQYSESKNLWNYLVKNLVLLDRCVEDRSFVSDIATIHILHVENYKDPDPKNNIIKIDGFIRKYFQYIKIKARLYAKKNSSFNVSKTEKRKFFQSLTTEQIYSEMNEATSFFTFIIEFVRTNSDPLKRISKRGYLEYKLNQYVFHLMLYTMMNLYITMFTIIAVGLERLSDTSLEEANKLKYFYIQFLKNNELFSQFVDDHKFIKGYEDIKVNEFYQPNRNALGLLNEWIALLESRKNQVDKTAITIKLSEDIHMEVLKIIKPTQNQVKQNRMNPQTKEDGSNFNSSDLTGSLALDHQPSNVMADSNVPSDLQNYEVYNSRYSDGLSRTAQGQPQTQQAKVNFLDTAYTGFDKDFFSYFKNDFSSDQSKGKFLEKKEELSRKLNKCNLLETYFQSSFQNTVSFMINDRFTTLIDATLKELPNFDVAIFNAFVNDYSVAVPAHYTHDDSRIKASPISAVQAKAQKSAIKVQEVYTIEGAHTEETSGFIAKLIQQDEKGGMNVSQFNENPQQKSAESVQSNETPQKLKTDLKDQNTLLDKQLESPINQIFEVQNQQEDEFIKGIINEVDKHTGTNTQSSGQDSISKQVATVERSEEFDFVEQFPLELTPNRSDAPKESYQSIKHEEILQHFLGQNEAAGAAISAAEQFEQDEFIKSQLKPKSESVWTPTDSQNENVFGLNSDEQANIQVSIGQSDFTGFTGSEKNIL